MWMIIIGLKYDDEDAEPCAMDAAGFVALYHAPGTGMAPDHG